MVVLKSIEDEYGLRCVDIFRRDDGSFGFKEFRRDPEDGGRWTLVADYSAGRYANSDETLQEAQKAISWITEAMRR